VDLKKVMLLIGALAIAAATAIMARNMFAGAGAAQAQTATVVAEAMADGGGNGGGDGGGDEREGLWRLLNQDVALHVFLVRNVDGSCMQYIYPPAILDFLLDSA
jgi:hypothetical protein